MSENKTHMKFIEENLKRHRLPDGTIDAEAFHADYRATFASLSHDEQCDLMGFDAGLVCMFGIVTDDGQLFRIDPTSLDEGENGPGGF